MEFSFVMKAFYPLLPKMQHYFPNIPKYDTNIAITVKIVLNNNSV